MGNSASTEPSSTVAVLSPPARDYHFYDPLANLDVGPSGRFAVTFSRSEQDFQRLCELHPDLDIARHTEGVHTYIVFEPRPQPIQFDQVAVDGLCLQRALEDAVRAPKFKEGCVFRGEAPFPSTCMPAEWSGFLREHPEVTCVCFRPYPGTPDMVRFSVWLRPRDTPYHYSKEHPTPANADKSE